MRVQANTGVAPRKMQDTMVAEIVEMSSGSIEFIDTLKSKISIVNSTPASGALKMPAMAPAAPQPRSMVMLRYDSPQTLPMLEPMAAPV